MHFSLTSRGFFIVASVDKKCKHFEVSQTSQLKPSLPSNGLIRRQDAVPLGKQELIYSKGGRTKEVPQIPIPFSGLSMIIQAIVW